MPRFRALLFGNPLSPWQANRELATQSAVEADEGSRDPVTGLVYLSPGVAIVEDDGEAPAMTADMACWAMALEIIQRHHAGARGNVETEIRRASQDPEAKARWLLIGKRIAAIMAAAAKDARPRP
ncbi:hypothetical protein [Sphingomonas abietis]|uniref:Uncharacterized protein n=1 Tax=Sphingomonas abietis TaxID=3012344 RepID=A0ABY7NKW4_9SPHN|nr:hypothetical protein [Sphingomonas abietis]WBO21993.1 hypothetical protein PBT88_17810 [Sphingomonas abietis]